MHQRGNLSRLSNSPDCSPTINMFQFPIQNIKSPHCWTALRTIGYPEFVFGSLLEMCEKLSGIEVSYSELLHTPPRRQNLPYLRSELANTRSYDSEYLLRCEKVSKHITNFTLYKATGHSISKNELNRC